MMDSSLITLAPQRCKICPQRGPAHKLERSSTSGGLGLTVNSGFICGIGCALWVGISELTVAAAIPSN